MIVSLRNQIVNYVKSLPRKTEDFLSYNTRCRSGNIDLIKGLPKAKPINEHQKHQISVFWKPYLFDWRTKHAFKYRWFDIYNRTNVFGFDLACYIPDNYYYSVVDKCLTNALDANVLDDKNLYDLYFHDVNQPTTIVRKIRGIYQDAQYNIISEDEAVKKCLDNKSVIIKPSINALAGAGIEFWKEGHDETELRQYLRKGNDIIVQDLIKQHSFLANFTDSCVNTMRIVTLLWEGDVIITTAVLIMGGPTAKTNHLHGGGIVCGILPTGQLRDTAFDGQLNAYKEHPNGMKFSEVVIPNYDKCIALVKKLAPRMGGISKFLNWDITLDKDGNPLLIEVNITWGGSVQIAGGPAFGDKTKDVLEYVKKTGTWKR